MEDYDFVQAVVEKYRGAIKPQFGDGDATRQLVSTLGDILREELACRGDHSGGYSRKETLARYTHDVVGPLVAKLTAQLEGGLQRLLYEDPRSPENRDRILNLTAEEFVGEHAHINGHRVPIAKYVRNVAAGVVRARGEDMTERSDVTMREVLAVSKVGALSMEGIGESTVNRFDSYISGQYGLGVGLSVDAPSK